ncbi:sieve element occlusion B-like protein [Tanacetum coccineum]
MQHPQQQLDKKERRMFTSSDDSAMMKQIVATHSPDGRDMNLEPILHVIEETLRHAFSASIKIVIDDTRNGHIIGLTGEEKAVFADFDDVNGIPDGLVRVIHKISCEVSMQNTVYHYRTSCNAHASTIAILNMLSSYGWAAKVVLSLGAFAVNVGEFWLVAHLFATNPLAKSVALLKQLPNIIEHYKSVKPQFDGVNVLNKAMLEVTECIIAFKNLPHQYIQDETSLKSTALTHIPLQLTEEKKHDEYFLMLERIFDVTQLDNLKIIKALFCATNDIHPLLDGSSKTRVNVDVLRKKTVLLLISDHDITHEEVLVLTQIYKESRIQPDLFYEVV